MKLKPLLGSTALHQADVSWKCIIGTHSFSVQAFVLPKMVENMDPEEVKKMKDDYKDGGGTTGTVLFL